MSLELVLSRTYACSLGRGKDGSRHDIEINAVALTEDMIDSADGLHLSGMGKHLLTINITYSIDTLNGCLIVLIYFDTFAFIIFETCIGEISLYSRLATCSHKDNVRINTLRLNFPILEEYLRVGNLFYTTLHVESNALLFKLLTETFGDVAVKGGETLLEELYHGYLRTKAIEDRGKLHADDTCTDDAEALGESVEIQQACGVDNARVIEAGNRDQLGLRTCGDDDVLGGPM